MAVRRPDALAKAAFRTDARDELTAVGCYRDRGGVALMYGGDKAW